jgi:phosphoribosylformimino-5-aminoimidazole carboxamide ribotide isomerase
MAMLIPSIDLMGGKIVQLVQGERKAIEFDYVDEWIERFSVFPLVQLVDLDAAMGTGDNHHFVRQLVNRLPCQVGGGIRSFEIANQMLSMGARRVIFGSSLIRNGEPDSDFAKRAARAFGSEKLVFAIDSKQGKVAINGWRDLAPVTALELLSIFEPWCGAFLYTNIDTEGLMQGIPMERVGRLRNATKKQLIVAGGISTTEEIDALDRIAVDAVVGMAIYTGRIDLAAAAAKRPLFSRIEHP